MAKTADDCVNEALSHLKHLTREELEEYTRDVFAEARENDISMEKAMDKVNNEKLASYFETAATKANTVRKVDKLVNLIKSKAADLHSIYIHRYDNLADNIASSVHAAKTKLHTVLFNNLSSDEMSYLENPKNNQEIISALDDKQVENQFAKKIASVIKEYMEYRNSSLVISGALPLSHINGDRMLRQIHDASKLRNGGKNLIESAKNIHKKFDNESAKPMWREYIKPLLNLDKTFRYTEAMGDDGKLDMVKVDEILDRVFDNIVTNKSTIFTKSTVANDKEALERRSRMFFHFKDWDSLHSYNKRYGRGTLLDALVHDASASSQQIGVAELFGDTPHNTYNELKKAQHEIYPLTGYYAYIADLYFKEVMHLDKGSPMPTAARIGSNIRSITALGRLFTLAARSLPDLAHAVAFDVRWGDNYFAAIARQLPGLFNLYKDEKRKEVAKQFKHMIASHQGQMVKYLDMSNTSELMNKMSTGFFNFNLSSSWDSGLQINAMTGIAERAAKYSSKKLDKTNPSFKKQILKYMDESEWDLLRKYTKNKLFTLDNVENISDEDLREYAKSKDIPVYEARTTLYRKVNAMFDVAAQNVVLNPAEFERANLLHGTQGGTPTGELTRFFTQFKPFTLGYMDRVIYQGWKDADTFQQKLAWGATLMTLTYPLSVMSNAIDYWANGLSYPDTSKMNAWQKIKFHLNNLASPLGMLAQFFNPMHADESAILNFIGSPSVSDLGELYGAAVSAAHGNKKQAIMEMKKAFMHILPLHGVPYLSPFLEKQMGIKPYLEPGQHRNK